MSDKSQYILSKLSNALIETAEAKKDFYDSFKMRDVLILKFVLSIFKKKYNGLWVGGRCNLTRSFIEFKQNEMNKSIHKADYSFKINLSEIIYAERRFGFFTGIVIIKTNRKEHILRLYNAKGFVNKVNSILNLKRI